MGTLWAYFVSNEEMNYMGRGKNACDQRKQNRELIILPLNKNLSNSSACKMGNSSRKEGREG